VIKWGGIENAIRTTLKNKKKLLREYERWSISSNNQVTLFA
jgi:hypothetical protein